MKFKSFFYPRRRHKEDRRAIIDLIVISCMGVITYFFAISFDLAEELFYFAERYEDFQFDELIIVSFVFSFMLTAFSFRRWLALRRQIELANTDSLTRVFNRRSISQLIKDEINKAASADEPLSIIMYDLDDFKDINDEYGHNTGDTVLQVLSQRVGEQIRATDSLGRWGGEEFVILTPATDLEGARVLAEKTRKNMEEQLFPGIGRVTASFGVAQYKTGDNVINFTHRADSQLYVAKKMGKNMVCANT